MKMQFLVAALVGASLVAGTAEARPSKRGKARQQHSMEMGDSSSSAQPSQNMAGCGLGSMVIQDNSKWSQVGAAFLNGTGMQTFGITFGTSNCTEDGVATASREKEAFVESNLADIRRDLSVGSGEYLSSLASFYGCKGEATDSFSRSLRKHQDKVMDAVPEQASRVIDSVVSEENASCQS